jgi:hypothetical protein
MLFVDLLVMNQTRASSPVQAVRHQRGSSAVPPLRRNPRRRSPKPSDGWCRRVAWCWCWKGNTWGRQVTWDNSRNIVLEWSIYHSLWKWLFCVLQILIIPLLYKEDTIGFHTSVRSLQGTFLDISWSPQSSLRSFGFEPWRLGSWSLVSARQAPGGWFCSCLVWTMFGVARHLVLSSQQASPWMKVDDTSTVNRLLSIWYSPRDLVAVLDLLIVGSISKFCISNSSNYNLV